MATLYFMTKGPPEIILPKCITNYLPKDINKILSLYRKSGFINLVLASKKINEYNYDKTYGEEYYMCDLIFCGIIVLRNKLKKDVKKVIQQLQNLNCDIILNTGDNIYNSLSVSYESGIISKKNIYVFDLNKTTGKITVDDLSELSKRENFSNIYSLDKTSTNTNNVLKKQTNTKMTSSRKLNIFINKLEKMNLFLGKNKNNNSKKLDESSSKKNLLSPYMIEKIKQSNIPELALEKMSGSIKNLSLKQDYSSPRKKNKGKRQINNILPKNKDLK